jgi:hypothetical protein
MQNPTAYKNQSIDTFDRKMGLSMWEAKKIREGYNMAYQVKISSGGILVYMKQFLELADAQSALSCIVYSEIYTNLFERGDNFAVVSSTIAQIGLTDEEIIALTPKE